MNCFLKQLQFPLYRISQSVLSNPMMRQPKHFTPSSSFCHRTNHFKIDLTKKRVTHKLVAPRTSLKMRKARSIDCHSTMEGTKAGNELSMEDLMGQLGNTSEYNELKEKVSKIEKSKVVASKRTTHT